MAVLAHADPIDRALDEIAALVGAQLVDATGAYVRIAGLWDVVLIGAFAKGDGALAELALRERDHYRSAHRRLADTLSEARSALERARAPD